MFLEFRMAHKKLSLIMFYNAYLNKYISYKIKLFYTLIYRNLFNSCGLCWSEFIVIATAVIIDSPRESLRTGSWARGLISSSPHFTYGYHNTIARRIGTYIINLAPLHHAVGVRMYDL